jgi:hypothetical protein
VILALITTVDHNVNLYTIGEPDDRDVRVAANVARELALLYEVWPPAASGATVDWRALVEAFIDPTDGLVPLFRFATWSTSSTRLLVSE